MIDPTDILSTLVVASQTTNDITYPTSAVELAQRFGNQLSWTTWHLKQAKGLGYVAETDGKWALTAEGWDREKEEA